MAGGKDSPAGSAEAGIMEPPKADFSIISEQGLLLWIYRRNLQWPVFNKCLAFIN